MLPIPLKIDLKCMPITWHTGKEQTADRTGQYLCIEYLLVQ